MPEERDSDDDAIKLANSNGIRSVNSGSCSHIKASPRRQHASLSPGTVSTISSLTSVTSSSLSFAASDAPHRILEAKASLSMNQRETSSINNLDLHRFSLESLVDDNKDEHEDEALFQETANFQDSQGTLTSFNDESRSFHTVEWVNGAVALLSERRRIQTENDDGWEDMEQATAERRLPRCHWEDSSEEFSVGTPALTAVVVDEEEERQRIEMGSMHSPESTALQAEVVDVKKRRIILASALLAAMVVIVSLVSILLVSKSNLSSLAISPNVHVVQPSEWVEIANAVSLSGSNLTYPGSQQASTGEQAVAWLIEQSDDVIERRAVQRFAFVVLAISWGNPDWNITADFDECRLKGVTCDADDLCIEMDLTGAAMVGTIPPEIALLTDMRKLVLWDNSLTGTVPWEPILERMVKMEFLDLDKNEFTGLLPSPEPGTWPLMKIFWVSKNLFTGTISSGFANWPNLQDLYIRDNLLTGTIPSELGSLSSMNWFAVDENDLHGTLPTEIGGWTNINHFEVEGNRGLTGTIPTEVGRWSMVEDFFCNMNQFSGSLPIEIGNWSRMKWFRTDFNSFTGTLPAGISSWTKLTSLFINNNDFTGALPAGIGSWSLLGEIQLNNNRLSGSFPSGIDSWEGLKHGYFQVNGFNGSVDDLCATVGSVTIVSADCCELVCPCCSSCFVDRGITSPNCTLPISLVP